MTSPAERRVLLGPRRTTRARLGLIVLALSTFALGSSVLLALTPYPALAAFRARAPSTLLLDRDGRVMHILPVDGGVRREWVALDDIPPAVQSLFVASEDRRFFTHPGVDPAAVMRGLVADVARGGTVSGASTITMQLARLVSPHRAGVAGKMLEALDAARIEARLDKRRILEAWLNAVPFGRGVEGVQSAARLYFGKPASELTPAEAALLAVMPRSPARYDPVTQPAAARRAALALAASIPRLAISPGEIDEALREASIHPWPFEAPHFVRFVSDRLGPAHEGPIRTSLDLELTHFLSERINYYVRRDRDARVTNGAGIVLDNRSGEILAYVGSRDFFANELSGQIDGVRIANESGSTLKPFLYALALERGYLPTTLLPDIPLELGAEAAYLPMNFDRRFHGPVRLRVALASSLNVPAVYAVEHIGISEFASFLGELGFTTLPHDAERLGPGIAIGNAQVSLLELARAFALFPRRGSALTLSYLRGGAPQEGNPRLLTRYAADEVASILSDNASRVTVFGLSSPLNTPFPAMFKTGTSNQFENLWAVGATRDYTAGVWMGNFNGDTIVGSRSSALPALIVAELLERLPHGDESFPTPSDSEPVKVCTLSGERAGPYCPSTTVEYLPRGTQLPSCSFHEAPSAPPRYPDLYAFWLAETGRGGAAEHGDGAESRGAEERGAVEGAAVEDRGRAPDALRILTPNDGALFYLDPSVDPADQAIGIQAAGQVSGALSVFVNGRYRGRLEYPYRYLFPLAAGSYRVELRSGDRVASVRFEVR